MSLSTLQQVRRSGRRPSGVIVLVGKPPRWHVDTPGIVVIDRAPAMLDLRALVGMPIHLIDLQSDEALLRQAMDATQAAGAVVKGACSAVGACGVSLEHETAMRRYREGLCLTE